MIRLARAKPIVLAVIALSICIIYLYYTPNKEAPAPKIPDRIIDHPLVDRQMEFWSAFHPILNLHNPFCPPSTDKIGVGALAFDAKNEIPRPDLLQLTEECEWAMTSSHSSFIQDIRSAKDDLKPVHTAGTRGLVSAAGREYLPVFVASLRMLRRTGSTLPVELYMHDATEYEKKICDEVLPALNAQCFVLSDVLETQIEQQFQIKVFAILLSSFEEVVWMDADCFPLFKPEELLDSDPFNSTGLVIWPDFWYSSTAPIYYKVSNQEVPAMIARQSSETGFILVSKKSHFLSLLLSAYYNYYGPSHYYRLFTQGAPGEGDKETFLQAASVMGEPFYTVSESVQRIGHSRGKENLVGFGMAQSDPREDYALTQQGKWRVKDPSIAPAPRMFFIHANYPKFNVGTGILNPNRDSSTATTNTDGSFGRIWTEPADAIRRFGWDAEKAYWEEAKWVTCNFPFDFKTWEDKNDLCDQVDEYYEYVFAQPHDDDPQFT
ncbi:hypothetical protein N7495_006623 [Penicillium taxi]|uniref:uncharacterized protein n=1 Tax=Penicillium taxi TaxID=168475 RepID=UPI002544E109|nr:uncharacterized protein N7495_006623 [Penicillium taxi]KAJ5894932.1 hypothetical protein N7495_006623 [Penicillium taxi]